MRGGIEFVVAGQRMTGQTLRRRVVVLSPKKCSCIPLSSRFFCGKQTSRAGNWTSLSDFHGLTDCGILAVESINCLLNFGCAGGKKFRKENHNFL